MEEEKSIEIKSKNQFRKEMEKAGDTLVVANFHQDGSSVKHDSDFGVEDYILLNIDLKKTKILAFPNAFLYLQFVVMKEKSG